MRNLFILSSLLFFHSNIIFADAIPTLSESDRISFASNIVSGQVTNVMHVDVGGACPRASADPNETCGAFYVDTLYYVTMKVFSTQKGNIAPGEDITISFWRATRRPEGWVGPTGQNQAIQKNSLIRAYINQDHNKEYLPIEPNGFDLFGYTTSN